MIARLTGMLEHIDEGSCLLALPASGAWGASQPGGGERSGGGLGLAHEVLLPAYLAHRLAASPAGSIITLHTLEYLESLNQGSSFIPRLIGFATVGEREFFELLTSVKGLGNKRALRAMASEPALIARAIFDRDTRALQRLPEIGPKLAELIVHELKSKVERFTRANSAVSPAPPIAAPGLAAVEALEAKPPRKPRVRLGEPVPVPASQGAAASASSAAAPAPAAAPPIRQSVEVLIALGEAPFEAERLVARALDLARAAGQPAPTTAQALIAAAYAAR